MKMEVEMIFAILGIQETKDKEIIQDAYREKLVDNNPEDHPEAFMRLRQAYEMALAYADSGDEENEEDDDDTPVGIWMSKVKKVYNNIGMRRDTETWKQLLSDDVCIELESCEDAKRKLFLYLMENFRLPVNVYKILNEKFGMEENENEMKEFLPVGFVDYMIEQIHCPEERDFAYEWLEGPEGANFDFFIQNLMQIDETMNEDLIQAQDVIEAMKATNITHPYLPAYESLLLAKSGFEEDALLLAREVIEQNPESFRVLVVASEAIYLAGEKEEAIANFNKAKENDSSCYVTEKYMAIYELERENFIEAIANCTQAMQFRNDETIRELSEEIDRRYLLRMKDKIENDQVPTEEIGEVIKALLRKERVQEAWKYVTDYPHVLEDVPYGESFLVDILSCKKDDESAISYGEKYAEELLACRCDDEEWKKAYFRTCYYTGKSYQNLAFEKREAKSRKMIDQLKEAASHTKDGYIPHRMIDGHVEYEPEEGWEFLYTVSDKDEYLAGREEYCGYFLKSREWFERILAEDSSDYSAKMEILISVFGTQDYQEMANLCEKYLEEMPGDFVVLMHLMQASYELENTTEVFELYNVCRSIAPSYFRVYEFVIRVFIDYNQYEDAMKVVEAARENHADNEMIDILECRIQVSRAREEMRCDTVTDILDRLLGMMKGLLESGEYYNNRERISEIFYVLALCEEFIQDQKLSNHEIEKKDGLDLFYAKCSLATTANPNLRFYTMGYFCKQHGANEDGARFYRLFLLFQDNHMGAKMQFGNCLVNAGYLEEGLMWYEKILEEDMDYQDICGRAAFYYRKLHGKLGIQKHIYRAVELAKYAVDREQPDEFDVMMYGKCLCDIGNYDLAIQQMKRLLDSEENQLEAYRYYGKCLRALGRFKEAVQILEEGISLLEDGEDDHYLFGELSRTCHRAFSFEDVQSVYMRAGVRGEYYGMIAIDYARALEKEGRYEDVIELFEKDGSDPKLGAFNESYRMRKVLEMKELIAVRDNWDLKMLEKEYQTIYKKYDGVQDSVVEPLTEKLANYYTYEEGDYDQALKYMNAYFAEACRGFEQKCEHHYWTGKETLFEYQNQYQYVLGNLMDVVRIYHLKHHKAGMEKYLSRFMDTVTLMYGGANEDETMERFGRIHTWGLSNTTMIVEYYIYRDDKERAKKWFDYMVSCDMCGECYHRGTSCTDKLEYMAMYYEYIGDMENAIKYYKAAYKVNPTINLSHYKLKQYLTEGDN